MPNIEPPPGARMAVIDIGSNSIRLVVYDIFGAALLPYYNEKVMAGLGRGVMETGHLAHDGVKIALQALGRFRAIVDGLRIANIRVIATAAVRIADDGPAFVARVAKEAGFDIEVLSGVDEAELSALGVLAGLSDVYGLVGDLGGTSLEFAQLRRGTPRQCESHNLGPLAFEGGYSRKERRGIIRKALGRSKALKPQEGGTFYAVGGAWRALAKLHMDLSAYPLRHLHAYALAPRDVAMIVGAVHASDPASRERVRKAGGRRAGILPHASLVLEEIVAAGAFSKVIISSFGVREGMVEAIRGASEGQGLFDGIHLVAQLTPGQLAFGHQLLAFAEPVLTPIPALFEGEGVDRRILRAACHLADFGARYHPDHRGQLAYDTIIRAPFAGITHRERAFLALCIGTRYARRLRAPAKFSTLLTGEEAVHARRLGSVLRLGATFSGRSADILRTSRLDTKNGKLVFSVPATASAMVSNTVERRLAAAADLFDLRPDIRIG